VPIVPFLGGRFVDRPEVYQQASPIHHVTPNSPTFLFFHGTADPLVSVQQSQRLAEQLRGIGVPAQVITFVGEGHGFTDGTNQKASRQLLAFLGEHLGR
jgi:dipeptidyl aminopeptidase/acylaminoacyl peptidase